MEIPRVQYQDRFFYPHATTCPAWTLWFSSPGCGCSVTDFWGWDAQGARLCHPDDDGKVKDESVVPGGALNLISTNYPDHGHRGHFSYSRKNAQGRAGNRTLDLMVSSQTLWPRGCSILGPIVSFYILGVLCFIKKYHMNIKHNYHVHKYDTRSSHDLMC
jgi:hypothetical protein